MRTCDVSFKANTGPEKALTRGQGVWRKVIRQEAVEELADAPQAEAWDNLGPYGTVREDLLGHHEEVSSGSQTWEQHVPAPQSRAVSMCRSGWLLASPWQHSTLTQYGALQSLIGMVWSK